MNELNINQIVIGGIYEHYKGTYVEVLDIGRNTETNEDMIIYHHVIHEPPAKINLEDPNDKTIWIRPAKVWFEEVEMVVSQMVTGAQVDINYKVPRFKLVWNPNETNSNNIKYNPLKILNAENVNSNKPKLGFRCDKCRKPSHAGVWGKTYPQPCFWCKGQYVYPGHPMAEECTEYDPMDPNNQFDTRPVLC